MRQVTTAPVRAWRLAILITVKVLCAGAIANGQSMEPRAYSPSPIDTNFLLASYLRTNGSVSLDPSLPITGAKASINTGFLGYDRTFDLFGRTASAAIVIPYINGEASGRVFGTDALISRSGLGDVGLRFTENLVGNPALPLRQFLEREPSLTVGTSLTFIVPTGDYNPQHLVNIGSNRWGFRPEIGVSVPLGNWFADAAVGGWFFTDNPNFLVGHIRGQAPELEMQAHGGYNFRPGLWLALDASYLSNGTTSLNGISNHDSFRIARYGLTFALPLTEGFSAKLSWATWLTAHNGGSYNTIGITLQYRWFDP